LTSIRRPPFVAQEKVDVAPAHPCSDLVPGGRLSEEHRRSEIGFIHEVECFGGHLGKWLLALNADTVDQYVDPAEVIGSVISHLCDRRCISCVEFHAFSHVTGGSDRAGQCIGLVA
jgi:hypothetical protein